MKLLKMLDNTERYVVFLFLVHMYFNWNAEERKPIAISSRYACAWATPGQVPLPMNDCWRMLFHRYAARLPVRESGLPPAGRQGALTPRDANHRAGQENGDCLDSHVVALSSTSKECLVESERKDLSAMMSPATMPASTVVTRRFTNSPITSLRRVKSIRGTRANGMPKLRITWLKTSVRVGSSPMTMTSSAGSMVMLRRIQIGILLRRKPCIIIWPAIVPTVVDDRPDAISEMANTQLAACPSNGVSVLYASSIVADLSQSGVVECRGGHNQHSRVYTSCQAHSDNDINPLKTY